MSTATVSLSPGYNLTGTTSGRTSAPITYSLNGISLGAAASTGGFEYTGFRNSDGETYTLIVAGKKISSSLTSGQLETITAALRPATAQIQQSITGQAVTAVPAAPAPTPIPPSPKPVVTETATSITTTTNGYAIVVDKPKTTTDPSKNPPTSAAILAADKPLTVTLPPLEIDEIGLNGKPTGKKIVVDPGTVSGGTANLEPTANSASTTSGSSVGLPGKVTATQSTATSQDQANFKAFEDWRVRLSLAPGANYLYNANPPGILEPLKKTSGVVFPYTPTISVNYAATYEPASIVHTNYTMHQYTKSSVDQVSITCDFTCQDTFEANYLLATIHFFRSMTKMFYGQDQSPKAGTPPPLCYLFGMGNFQFAAHPLAITGFSYNLPNDVDYISTTSASPAGSPTPAPDSSSTSASVARLPKGVAPGGTTTAPQFNSGQKGTITWVPTKIQLSITCIPILSRNQISSAFSLKEYANGNLINGTARAGGGMW